MAAGALALIMIPAFLWCVAGTRERFTAVADQGPRLSLFTQFRSVLGNIPFRFVMGIFLCSWVALQITSNVLPFYIIYWLRRSDLIATVLLTVQGSAMLWLFIWGIISRRIGKKAVYLAGMSFWVLVQAGLFLLPSDQTTLGIILAAMAGAGVATAYLVPWSMMTDVIEVNEIQIGQRLEGISYAMMIFFQKLGIALSIFLVGNLLEWQGFDETASAAEQPASAIMAIRVMIGPLPTVLLIIGMVFAFAYPLTRERHRKLLDRLAEQRSESIEPA